MIAAGGDTQHSAHRGDWIIGLAITHQPEPFGGIAFVSRANQAAAFERISRSSRSLAVLTPQPAQLLALRRRRRGPRYAQTVQASS
jgi:hypothetical protein